MYYSLNRRAGRLPQIGHVVQPQSRFIYSNSGDDHHTALFIYLTFPSVAHGRQVWMFETADGRQECGTWENGWQIGLWFRLLWFESRYSSKCPCARFVSARAGQNEIFFALFPFFCFFLLFFFSLKNVKKRKKNVRIHT